MWFERADRGSKREDAEGADAAPIDLEYSPNLISTRSENQTAVES